MVKTFSQTVEEAMAEVPVISPVEAQRRMLRDRPWTYLRDKETFAQ